MSAMKDFTPDQIDCWVEQELAKSHIRAKIETRIATEKHMLTVFVGLHDQFPNSTEAHRRLLAKLEERLKAAS